MSLSTSDQKECSSTCPKRRHLFPVGMLIAVMTPLWWNLSLVRTAPQQRSLLDLQQHPQQQQQRHLLRENSNDNVNPLIPIHDISTSHTSSSSSTTLPYDAFNTPAVQCRLALEQWQNNNIDWWMTHPPYPIVEYVWKYTDASTRNPYYLGLFHLLKENGNSRLRAERVYELAWEWQDQYGNNYTVGTMNKAGMKHVRLYFRLDPPRVHTNNGEGAIIPQRMWPTLPNGTIPIVYDLQPYIQCNQIEQQPPNRPPKEAKIGACITRFWGQHDLIPEWIAYHRLLGVQHFWLFVSEPFGNVHQSALPRYEKDITYIPYNYTWKGHRRTSTTGPSEEENDMAYGGENWFQPMANNQCLHLAKQYEFDWIFTPDVDEYVAILDPTIDHHFGVGEEEAAPPLQQYLQRFQEARTSPGKPKLGEVCLYGGGYGRHPTKETDPTQFQLTIDFTYRRDRKLGSGEGTYDGKGAGGRKKCFYNAQVVKDVLIHEKVQGGSSVLANTTEIELMHFRSPLLGPQEARPDKLVSYPETRDIYRDKIVEELIKSNWTFPILAAHVDQGYTSLMT